MNCLYRHKHMNYLFQSPKASSNLSLPKSLSPCFNADIANVVISTASPNRSFDSFVVDDLPPPKRPPNTPPEDLLGDGGVGDGSGLLAAGGGRSGVSDVAMSEYGGGGDSG